MTRLPRAELLRTLESVKPGLSAGITTVQSNMLAFRGGMVFTMNREACCRCPTGLPEELACAVQADVLQQTLETMEEEDVEVGGGGDSLVVRSAYSEVRVAASPEISMPIKSVTRPGPWKDLPPEFAEAVAMAAEATSKDDTRFVLNAVSVRPDWVEATDNNRMVRYALKTGLGPFLLQRDPVARLPEFEPKRYADSEGWLHLRNPHGATLSLRKHVEDEIPDLIAHFHLDLFKGVPTTIPKGLINQSKLAEIFVAKEGKVTVRFEGGQVKVRAEGAFGKVRSRPRKVSYKGPPAEFRIGPRALAELARRSNDCEVGDRRIKIDGGSFVFFTSTYEANGEANGQKE